MTSYFIALAAGVLSTLSPCVLPLLPVIIGSAMHEHRYGPFAVAIGMSASFAVIGTILASAGARLGVGQGDFQVVAAIVLVLIGVVLLSKKLQERFAVATSGASGAGSKILSTLNISGLRGQFLVGLLLGLIWSPCVGPTLGAAITLASQGRDLPQIVTMMAVFGLGAGLPIALLGMLSRQAMLKMRGKLQGVGSWGKSMLGVLFIAVGLLILTGWDKSVEVFLLDHSPDWLTTLTTSL
ncbi:cytochrome c biogenesis protein CcdA [Herbaspirillum sp. 3R11]|nr:cytochrome c biogenesis protein CcdA [Herbaspirillum sp. 3R-3a1]TFI11441.1 cytochrome c biogenesis protein CcdA [Herbaspirillum sp. 3R11]TFI17349.1 cytochrome c biogenesis protein CcdA [Herbaspirillum sp. 3R-11]TFI18699.1 cytochrome c biogenesis protein CcdA [Herbaspirillum sp. 3C11]